MANAIETRRTRVSCNYQNSNEHHHELNFTIINCFSREDQYSFFTSPPPFSLHKNILIAFIFPAMVALIQLMYQASYKSPFELHLIKMYLAISSFFIYCFSCHAQLRLNISISNQPHTPNYPKIFVSIFGPLTFASYSSIHFPPLCLIIYLISTSYSATQLLNCKFEERLYWLYRKFMSYYANRPHNSILPI
ncbi:hypothetical protein P3S67_008605 [Capsicum chacoense]